MDNLFLNTYGYWLGNTTLKLLLEISFLLVESSTIFSNNVWYPKYKECLHFSILVVGGGRSLSKYACAFDKNNPDWKCQYWTKIKPLFCSFPNLRSGKKCKGRLIAGYKFSRFQISARLCISSFPWKPSSHTFVEVLLFSEIKTRVALF